MGERGLSANLSVCVGWDFPSPPPDSVVEEIRQHWAETPEARVKARNGSHGASVSVKVDLDDARDHDATMIPREGVASDTYSSFNVDDFLVQFATFTPHVRQRLNVAAVTVHVVYRRDAAPDAFDRYLTLSSGTLAELAKIGANVDIFFY